jgi:hypothetical protein
MFVAMTTTITGGAASARAPHHPPTTVETRALVVSGRAPASALIRIARDVTIGTTLHARRAEGPNPSIELGDADASTGVALVRAEVQDATLDDVALAMGRLRGCSSTCGRPMTVNYAYPWARRARIPAGMYRVYVLGEGASSVTLRLSGGAPGTTAVRATEPAAAQAVVPAARVEAQGVVSAGSVFGVEESGFRLSLLAVDLEDRGPASVVGTCTYQDAGQPDEVRFLPGCPEGAPASRHVYPVPSTAATFYFDDVEVVRAEGDVAYGMWHVSRIAVRRALHATIFLEL